MDEPAVRKTFQYKLKPTPQQEQAMAVVVRRCRELYNAALHERRPARAPPCTSAAMPGRSAG